MKVLTPQVGTVDEPGKVTVMLEALEVTAAEDKESTVLADELAITKVLFQPLNVEELGRTTGAEEVTAGILETGALEAVARIELETEAEEAGALEAGALEAGALEAGAEEAGALEAGAEEAVARRELETGAEEAEAEAVGVVTTTKSGKD